LARIGNNSRIRNSLIEFSLVTLILGPASYQIVIKPLYYSMVPFSEEERQAVVTEAARILSERYVSGIDDLSVGSLRRDLEDLLKNPDRILSEDLQIQELTPRFKEMIDRSLILVPVSSDTRGIFNYEHKTVNVYRGDGTKGMAMKMAESFAFLFQIEKLRGYELMFIEKNGTTYDTSEGTVAEWVKRWGDDLMKK